MEINQGSQENTPQGGGSDPTQIAASITSQGTGGQETPPANPNPGNDPGTQDPQKDTPAGGDDPFVTKLVEATGGKVKSAEELSGIIERAGQLDSLQAKIQQMEAQSKLSPFANDFVKSANDFFKSGGTTDEYYRLLDLKRVEVDGMEPLDVIRRKYEFENPGFSPQEIDALIKKDIGNFEGEVKEEGGQPVVDPIVSAEIRRQGNRAKDWLKQQQDSVATPAAALDRQTQQAQMQKMDEAWSTVTNFALGEVNNIELQFDGIEDQFSFPIPADFKNQLNEAVKMFAMNAHREGQLPLTSDGYESTIKPALQDWARRVVMMNYGPDIIKAAVAHATAATTKKVKTEAGGIPPKNPDTGQAQNGVISKDVKQAIKDYYSSPGR